MLVVTPVAVRLGGGEHVRSSSPAQRSTAHTAARVFVCVHECEGGAACMNVSTVHRTEIFLGASFDVYPA